MGERQDYLSAYRDAVARHGASFEATLWGSAQSQILRFDVIIDRVDLTGRTVVDIGCGQGDLAARLHERGVHFARYVGIDAMAPMIGSARDRGLSRCDFVCTDVLEDGDALRDADADWAVLSGTLNTMTDDLAQTLVGNAFDAAREGVAFNYLGDHPGPQWADRDLGPARRFSVARWLEWAWARTSRVEMTQAYLDGHDVTVVVRRDQGSEIRDQGSEIRDQGAG